MGYLRKAVRVARKDRVRNDTRKKLGIESVLDYIK